MFGYESFLIPPSVMVGASIGVLVTIWAAWRGTKGAIQDLDGHSDQLEASARQTRQDVASIVWVLVITNGILAAILVKLLL